MTDKHKEMGAVRSLEEGELKSFNELVEWYNNNIVNVKLKISQTEKALAKYFMEGNA